MATTLYYSVQTATVASQVECIVQLDSDIEWNAETQGKEPGYAQFCRFLTDLAFRLSNKPAVVASFPEGESARRLIEHARIHSLRYTKYPRTIVEEWLSGIVSLCGFKRGIGTGISFLVMEPQELQKILEYSARPCAWLFLAADGEARIEWTKLQPFYLAQELGETEDDSLRSGAKFILYHETHLCYAEIASCSLSKERLLSALHGSASSFQITLADKV